MIREYLPGAVMAECEEKTVIRDGSVYMLMCIYVSVCDLPCLKKIYSSLDK